MPVELRTLDGSHLEFDSQRDVLGPTQAIPCFRCGECCVNRRPILLRDDVLRLARGLGIPLLGFYRRYIERHPSRHEQYLFRQRLGDCPFLERHGAEALCSVHAFKPAACEAWTPSLWRQECRQGLAKRLDGDGLTLPKQLYANHDELAAFYRALRGELGSGRG